MTKLRFEAWTLPTSAEFKPLFDRPLPAVDGTGVVELSDYTDGTVTVPASWEGLKTWNGGWIRVYLGDVLIDEFLAERAPVDLQRPGTVTFSGPSVNGLVEKCAVYPYNYPNDAPGAQDWHWGLDENMLRNGDADENPLGLENPGFEDGVRAPWWASPPSGVRATFNVSTTNPRTGTYHGDLTALLLRGGASTNLKVVPGRTYRFAIYGATDTGTHVWEVGASGPEGITPRDGAEYVENTFDGEWASGHAFEVQQSDEFTTSYSQLEVRFTAAADQTNTQISVREAGGSVPATLYLDDLEWEGFGIGTDGWEFSSGVTEFQAVEEDGDWAFLTTANRNHGPFQVVRVIPGETVTVAVEVKGSGTWSLELRDARNALLGQHTITATGSFTLEEATFTLPTFLPGADGEVKWRLVNRSSGAETIYWRGARMYSGLPKATATEIIRLLVEAAQSRGTFTFLDLDFTDTHDSANTELSPISLSVFFGAGGNLSQPLSALKQMGYEWEIVALETPADGKTHELKLWGPASTIGDLTASPGGPSVLAGANIVEGSATTRIPEFTSLLVHGQGAARLEDTNDTAEGTYGRWERIVDAESITDPTQLQLVADAKFTEEEANRLALNATVLATAQSIPLVDYRPGNTIWWQFPGVVEKTARKLRRVGWSHREIAEFTLQASRTLSPSGGIAVAVQRLMREFKRRAKGGREAAAVAVSGDPVVTDSFGAFAHLAGGSQSVDNAAVEFSQLLASPLSTILPAFPATQLQIQLRGYYSFYVDVEFSDWFQGGDIWITRTRGGDTTQVWPPLGVSGLWSSSGGSRFTDIAPAIDCEPGDVYQLWVDCGEEVVVSRAVFVPWLADRLPAALGGPPGELLVFTESGSHDFGSGVLLEHVWIIAGGGAGGRSDQAGIATGGGGAGGVVHLTNQFVGGVQAFTVGDGGQPPGSGGPGGKGGDSVFLGQTAEGGGGGGYSGNGGDGGCGGGGGTFSTNPGGTGSQGGNGGASLHDGLDRYGGGGGGYSENGHDGGPNPTDSDGGDGIDLSAWVGTDYGDDGWFAGGGGGAKQGQPHGRGGKGGGGNADGAASGIPVNGMPNTGGGGGGDRVSGPGAGGSGIIICVVGG